PDARHGAVGVGVPHLPAGREVDHLRPLVQRLMRHAPWAAVLLAAVAGLAPIPRELVERWYSTGVYPSIQPILTSLSNLTFVPLFDVLCLATIGVVVVATYRVFDATGRRGAWNLLQRLVQGAAVAYLVFLAIWGMNYRRVPLTG